MDMTPRFPNFCTEGNEKNDEEQIDSEKTVKKSRTKEGRFTFGASPQST